MVQPLAKPKRVKKFGFKRFNRHQCDRKIAVKVGNCCNTASSELTVVPLSIRMLLQGPPAVRASVVSP
jgi:hypothetical protein